MAKELLDTEICFKLNSGMRKELKEVADRDERSEASVIRLALKHYIAATKV